MKTRKRPLLTQAILTDILLMTKQQALFTFRFRIIIVTEGSFSLTVRYIQCNKRKTKNTLHVRKCLASK